MAHPARSPEGQPPTVDRQPSVPLWSYSHHIDASARISVRPTPTLVNVRCDMSAALAGDAERASRRGNSEVRGSGAGRFAGGSGERERRWGVEGALERFAGERLVHEKLFDEVVELGAVAANERGRRLGGLVHQAAHLLVDQLGGALGVVAGGADGAPEEGELLLVAEGDRAEPLAHAVLLDHRPRQLGGARDVVVGAGANLAEYLGLGGASAERGGEARLELRAGPEPAILLGQEAGCAGGKAAGDDADLVDRVVVLQVAADQRVAALVVGGDALLALREQAALALRAGEDALERLLQLGQVDGLLVASGRQDGALVEDVGEVGAR